MEGANWYVDQHSVLAVSLPRLRPGQGMETRGQRIRLPLNSLLAMLILQKEILRWRKTHSLFRETNMLTNRSISGKEQ